MQRVPQSRGLPKHHLSAKGCPGFTVECNTYNISGNDLILLTFFLQGMSQSRGLPKHHLAAKGCLGNVVEFNIIWQPKATQDFLWNLILAIFMEMTPCCLPFSCRECLRVEDHLNMIWQPQAAQDLLCNFTSFSSRRLLRICFGI